MISHLTVNDLEEVVIFQCKVRLITGDGLGVNSLLPVFIWAENEIQITDGKCHCTSPKPIILLVRIICDNCGNEMSTASQNEKFGQ